MTLDPTVPPVPEAPVVRLGGRIRVAIEDFLVEEIPLYPPTGEGEHLMVWVEKRDLTTPEAARRLAQALGVPTRGIGWAGYKDRRAVTRQWMTFPGNIDPERAAGASADGVTVLDAARHRNRLRTGHLFANRFEIRVREANPVSEIDVRNALADVVERGVPNGYGPQRFGATGRNHILGAAVVAGDGGQLIELVSEAVEGESESVASARAALRNGHPEEARFPRAFELEGCVARELARGTRPGALLRRLPHRGRDFIVSAWQSACFNRVLAARLPDALHFLPGDIATKLPHGACFRVEDPALEQPRADRLEIAPTGPLPGRKVMWAQDAAGEIESAACAAEGWKEGPVPHLPKSTFLGARRALVVPFGDAGVVREATDTFCFTFTLPRGSFATSALALFGVAE